MSGEATSFDTDWEAIETFVRNTNSKGELEDSVRAFMKGRLESPQEHIVVITLSVFDSLAVNCGARVREQLASSRWVKLLLEAFISNISKPAVRDAVQQLFSNWRALFRGEALGREARTVCTHMRSKNYVMPPPMEYPPEVVRVIRTGEPTSTFVRGTDFMAMVRPESVTPSAGSMAGSLSGESSTSRIAAHHSRVPSLPDAAVATAATAAAASRAASHGTGSNVSSGALGSHTSGSMPRAGSLVLEGPGTDVPGAVARMERDAAALDSATKACEAAAAEVESQGEAVAGAKLDTSVAECMEAAAKCGSWQDTIQVMIERGIEGDDMMALLAAGDLISSSINRWERTSKRLKKRIPGLQSRPGSGDACARAAAADTAGPKPEATAEERVPAASSMASRQGNPFGEAEESGFLDTGPLFAPGTRGTTTAPSISAPMASADSEAGPFGAASLPPSQPPSRNASTVPASFTPEAAAAAAEAEALRRELERLKLDLAAERRLASEAAQLRQQLDQQAEQQRQLQQQLTALHEQLAKKEQQEKERAAVLEAQATDGQLAARMGEELQGLKQALESTTGELKQEREGRTVAEAQLRAAQAALERQQHTAVVAAAAGAGSHAHGQDEELQVEPRGNSAASAVEWALLAGGGGRGLSSASLGAASGASSSRALGRALTRGTLAKFDSFSAASASFSGALSGDEDKGPGLGKSGGNASRVVATAGAVDALGQAFPAQLAPAELLQAYRRLPALRVRFSPQHFANVVTAVSSEWA